MLGDDTDQREKVRQERKIVSFKGEGFAFLCTVVIEDHAEVTLNKDMNEVRFKESKIYVEKDTLQGYSQ